MQILLTGSGAAVKLKNGQGKKQAQGLFYSAFSTAMGYAAVVADSKGVIKVYFPAEEYDSVVNRLKKDFPSASEGISTVVAGAKEKLCAYFRGENVRLDTIPIGVLKKTGFSAKVLELVRTIPYGETRTYKWTAEQLKSPNSVRAAGNALKRNPVPILIPCHRIIKSGGELGGFSSGLEWKIKLLKLENVIA